MSRCPGTRYGGYAPHVAVDVPGHRLGVGRLQARPAAHRRTRLEKEYGLPPRGRRFASYAAQGHPEPPRQVTGNPGAGADTVLPVDPAPPAPDDAVRKEIAP